MGIEKDLTEKLLGQAFTESGMSVENARGIAAMYAMVENALVVLSDMKEDKSYIYYGGLSEALGIESRDSQIPSIWERDILRHIHPEDLERKQVEELRFYHFVKNLPKTVRKQYYLSSEIRMCDASGLYHNVLHRMFYLDYDANGSSRFTLCLYVASVADVRKHLIVNTVTGKNIDVDKQDCDNLLTSREKEILKLIDNGLMSKSIADKLSISLNTVNRHRQNILEKLQAHNSIEACQIARKLNLL